MNNSQTIQEPIINKNRLRKSISQKRIVSKTTRPKKIDPPKQQKSIKIEFEVPEVKYLITQFQKEISIPIAFHKDVLRSNSLPKCITHNNVITLYCISDRKPLCVSCLYLSHVHKPHKVVPLTRAIHQLKENFNQSLQKSKRNVPQLQKLIQINEQNLFQTEKQYPALLQKLHNFYLQMHQMLIRKKDQQLQQLTQNWSRLRYTYNCRKQQLSKILQFTKRNLQSLQYGKGDDILLYNRNVSFILSNVDTIARQDLRSRQEGRFEQDFKKFNSLKQLMDKELVFMNLFIKQEPLKLNRSIRYITNQEQSRVINQQRLMKLTLNKRDDKKDSRQATSEGLYSLTSSVRKNRHSKSDLLSKMSVSEKRRMKQKSEQKKKMQIYHKNILINSQKKKFKKQLNQFKTPVKQKSKKVI